MKIIDKGFDKITRDIERMGKVVIAVGILAKEADLTYGNGISLGEVAHIQEYGVEATEARPGIPERPFMSGTATEYEAKMLALQSEQLGKVIDGTKTVDTAADELGEWYQGSIQAHILNGKWAPNASSTTKRKGHDQPLIDTKLLYNNIKYKVLK